MTQVPPVECWIIVDQQNRFFRMKLPKQSSCYVTVFSTEALAQAYINQMIGRFAPEVRLEPKHYTWDGIVERLGWQMSSVILDHEHVSDEGTVIPLLKPE